MSDTKKKSAAKPIKTIRHGAVGASIWKRQAPSGFEYFDFSLSRSWKTQTTGREGYSPNFFAGNLDDLQATVSDAASWIASQQACLLDAPDDRGTTSPSSADADSRSPSAQVVF